MNVVVRHDFFRAVICEGEKAAAPGHHLLRALRHGGERIARDVHRHGEIFRRRFEVAPLELLLVEKAMAWTRKSSRSHFRRSVAKAASMEAGCDTSQSISAAGFSGSTRG